MALVNLTGAADSCELLAVTAVAARAQTTLAVSGDICGVDKSVVPMAMVIHSKAHEEGRPVSAECQSLSVLSALHGEICS